MCGRFAIISPVDELIDAFGVVEAEVSFSARYNLAPTQDAPVIHSGDGGGGPWRMELFRWGLIPGWAQDARLGQKLINARSETAAEKPSFREAMRRRRCLVPCDGFYEWQKIGQRKQPHFIRLKSRAPFAMAGLWERWSRDGAPVLTFTLLTCPPNALLAGIHDRMPVILPADRWARWLADGPLAAGQGADLLRPYPAEEMEAYPVSDAVNSTARDDADLIAPAGQIGLPLG
jgi:putative SOS response-associated peptidase YedK